LHHTDYKQTTEALTIGGEVIELKTGRTSAAELKNLPDQRHSFKEAMTGHAQ